MDRSSQSTHVGACCRRGMPRRRIQGNTLYMVEQVDGKLYVEVVMTWWFYGEASKWTAPLHCSHFCVCDLQGPVYTMPMNFIDMADNSYGVGTVPNIKLEKLIFLWTYSVNSDGWSDFCNLLNVLPEMHKPIRLNGQAFTKWFELNFFKTWKGRKAEK